MPAAIQIIVLVLLPLLVYAHRQRLPWSEAAMVVGGVVVLWYLTYAPLHELTHMLALLMAGGTPVDWRIVPRFWASDYPWAYVLAKDATMSQTIVAVSAPYVRDLLLAPAGAVLLRGGAARRPFSAALVFAVTCAGSIYDVVSNLWGFLLRGVGDFGLLAQVAGDDWAWGLGMATTAAAAIATGLALMPSRAP